MAPKSEKATSDILIVGAGAAGAAAAWRLAGQGFKVTCLEQGGWVNPAASPSSSPEWEMLRQGPWHPNPNIRKGPADWPVDDRESDIEPLFFNGVGGSTIMWSCHFPRLHPGDFCTRTLDGCGDDWPIGYHDLEPYYDLNERMMGVAGLAGNPAYPPMAAPRSPPVGLSPGARRVAEAFNRLGWSWWPADLSIRTGTGDHVCNNCGPCELHCPRQAKGATDLSYWPAALSLGAELITGARVVDIETDGHQVVGVVYSDGTARHRRTAPVVVLAANGIGTSRLLLHTGLANRSGLVGRRLMLHPLARVTGIFGDPLDSHRGIAAGALVSHHFYETDKARGFRRGVKLQGLGSQGPALIALGAHGQHVAWGRGHHAEFRKTFGHIFGLSICSDDMPDPENRIVLCDNASDDDGVPVPRMIYRVPQEARAALDFGKSRAREALKEAGAISLVEMETVRSAGFHLMGTARMGHDPETSVVDGWGEAHDLKGLFIVDGSTFVTAAAVNPTNTIQAIALRAADHLIRTRRARNT
ncbi:MAG: GMC family oxidoreductase [Roseibium sp.]|nr:GMC family oxidoreductase [Roseibium sp.]